MIRENLNIDGESKITGLALLLSSTPLPLIYWLMSIATIIISFTTWLLVSWLAVIALSLFWLSTATILFHIGKSFIFTYHQMTKQHLEREKIREQVEQMRIKNDRERAKLDMDRFMPRIIEEGCSRGSNISYSAKGDLSIADWRSNIHQIVGADQGQIEAPKTQLNRISVAECVDAIEQNSYKTCLGTLADTGERAVVSFKKRHLKFIGASQMGKSSLVGLFLDVVSQTHSPENVKIALLDLEDQTSNLFARLPHTIMHGRNIEEVLSGLSQCVAIMDNRYELSRSEVDKEPLLLIYIEEFLELKNRLKLLDKKLYAKCVSYINSLAIRGLKAKCQLALCAQTDYRDVDFAAALCNIPCGFSLSLKPEAARAAGFTKTELLNRNFSEKQKGVFVVEHTDLSGIVVAGDYDLENRLIAYEQTGDDYQNKNLLHLNTVAIEPETDSDLDLIYETCQELRESGSKCRVDDVTNALADNGNRMARGKVGALMKKLREDGAVI